MATNLNLTTAEQRFLDSLLGSIDPVNPAYLSFAERYLANYLNDPSKLVTGNARALMEVLHYKVASAILDKSIDRILSEPTVLKKNVTKAKSLKLTKATLGEKQQLVYSALATAGMPLSRREVADRTDLRLSSVCARVQEMMEAGLVRVSGTKWDADSEREVESLEVV